MQKSTIFGLLAAIILAVAASAPGQTLTLLAKFHHKSDGAAPDAPLIRDRAGNLYGTTAFGGTSDNGTIFKIDHVSGKITVLHRFISVDGVSPHAGLIRDSEGNSYGTTDHGGDTNCNPPNGCGTVFQLNRTGKLIVLHTFTGPDGDSPGHATLLRDSSGALYGTAVGGGPGGGGGVVFKLDPDGAETVLHTFSERADGNGPSAGLVRDVDGNLYGTTVNGGIFNDTTCQVVGCGWSLSCHQLPQAGRRLFCTDLPAFRRRLSTICFSPRSARQSLWHDNRRGKLCWSKLHWGGLRHHF